MIWLYQYIKLDTDTPLQKIANTNYRLPLPTLLVTVFYVLPETLLFMDYQNEIFKLSSYAQKCRYNPRISAAQFLKKSQKIIRLFAKTEKERKEFQQKNV